MILNRSDGEQIGVQVKRWHGKIQAGQIRELAGALVLNDLGVPTLRRRPNAPADRAAADLHGCGNPQ